MTNEEMISWARIPVEIRGYETLNRLIWIARAEEQKRIWGRLRDIATMEHDAASLSSYPGGLMPTDEDYMAALGPCGK